MAKKIKEQKRSSPAAVEKKSMLQKWEERLSRSQKTVLLISLLVSLIFSMLLFNIKITELNDDSLYIEGAYNFAQNIRQPFTANAPLYPLLLSIPVKFFGINLVSVASHDLGGEIAYLQTGVDSYQVTYKHYREHIRDIQKWLVANAANSKNS